jgi:DNA/RNA endonuclease YhcR with UshA esterase domain
MLMALCLCPLALPGADSVSSADAKNNVGKNATVCGKVVGTRYLENSQRRPTFLNFDMPYPDHTFTAIIFGDSRAKFGKPEETYLQKNVCVTGEITLYNGKPQVELKEPSQIRFGSR